VGNFLDLNHADFAEDSLAWNFRIRSLTASACSTGIETTIPTRHLLEVMTAATSALQLRSGPIGM
jgi:hypothetical protein